MKKISISIITPLHQAEKFLTEMLDSVATQTFDHKKLEVILIYDGPQSEKTDSIISEFRKNNEIDILLIYNNINRGPGFSRQKALEVANGEYIYFLDSDDTLTPSGLEKLYEKIIFDDCDYVIGDHETDQEKPSISFIASVPGESLECWNKLFKKSFLLENEIVFLNIYCGEDAYFCLQVDYCKTTFSYTDQVTMSHRSTDNTNTITATASNRNIADIITLIQSTLNLGWLHLNKVDSIEKNYIAKNINFIFNYYPQKSGYIIESCDLNLQNELFKSMPIKYQGLLHQFKNDIPFNTLMGYDENPTKTIDKKTNITSCSILITTKNGSDRISKTLTSILQQSYQNINEIIIIDSNGRNSEQQLCTHSQLMAYMSNIKYLVLEEPGNIAHAYNMGLQHATGDYIAFLDDHHTWRADYLTKQINLLKTIDSTYQASYCATQAGTWCADNFLTGDFTKYALLQLWPDIYLKPSNLVISRQLSNQLQWDTELLSHEFDDYLLQLFQHSKISMVNQCLVDLIKWPNAYKFGSCQQLLNIKKHFIVKQEKILQQFATNIHTEFLFVHWFQVVKFAMQLELIHFEKFISQIPREILSLVAYAISAMKITDPWYFSRPEWQRQLMYQNEHKTHLNFRYRLKNHLKTKTPATFQLALRLVWRSVKWSKSLFF